MNSIFLNRFDVTPQHPGFVSDNMVPRNVTEEDQWQFLPDPNHPPMHTQLRSKLAAYWGDRLQTPRPQESRYCLILAAVIFALLGATWNSEIAAGSSGAVQFFATVGILCWKLACAFLEYVLLSEHYELRQAYGYPYRRHSPAHIGVLGASAALILRTMIFRTNVTMPMLLGEFEMWFWAVYWVEWWTGASLNEFGYLGIF